MHGIPDIGNLDCLDERQARLARMIDGELLPRLMRSQDPSHSAEISNEGFLDGTEAFAEPVAELARIVLTSDFSMASAYVRTKIHNELSLEDLCSELLAPTARRLGEMWERDLCHFADVTLALWRLQQVLREFSEVHPYQTPRREHTLSALLVPAPGEQHTFGLSIVMEFFVRAGWDVCGGPPGFVGELRDLIRTNWFDVIGFSVSSDKGLDPLASCIREVRVASRNPGIGVLVGGSVFIHHPELVATVGADLLVVDGQQAPLQAERLLASIARDRN
jgi:methanogenic corrinoid protein MtbC1